MRVLSLQLTAWESMLLKLHQILIAYIRRHMIFPR